MLVSFASILGLSISMEEITEKVAARNMAFVSSVSDDVWHARQDEKAFEWWYFDALSDDGREAVVITFTDNYVFSPRYFESHTHQQPVNAIAGDPKVLRFPAVTFLYSVDGKIVFKTVNEFGFDQFVGRSGSADCSVGRSSISAKSASYGSGHIVTVDVPLGPDKRLRAAFEWLTVEGDLMHDATEGQAGFLWNMVSPRSDVSGRIEVLDQTGKSKQLIHYRGTGYHDHVSGTDALNEILNCRQWGRAHFNDCTAVYCVVDTESVGHGAARLIVTRDGTISMRSADVGATRFQRDLHGIRYPQRIVLNGEDDVCLRAKPVETIESTFYNVRSLSEMTLTLNDGKPRKTIGISEIVSPKNMKYKLFRWLSDLQIDRKEGGSHF